MLICEYFVWNFVDIPVFSVSAGRIHHYPPCRQRLLIHLTTHLSCATLQSLHSSSRLSHASRLRRLYFYVAEARVEGEDAGTGNLHDGVTRVLNAQQSRVITSTQKRTIPTVKVYLPPQILILRVYEVYEKSGRESAHCLRGCLISLEWWCISAQKSISTLVVKYLCGWIPDLFW